MIRSPLKLAINGLGRIGRCALRIIAEQKHAGSGIELVAVNATRPASDYVTLLQYDSVHGKFSHEVTAQDNELIVNNQSIRVFNHKSPQEIPWQQAGVDVVLECTGKFNDRQAASGHLEGGSKRVIISAPCKDPDVTVVYGVNHQNLQLDHRIISVASCTTNALAPLAKVLNDAIGIEVGYMTTIHAYTMDQNVLDNSHKDIRRARACSLSMIPSTTGAAKALGLVIPELAGKISGSAVRVPVPNVSMIDFVFTAQRDVGRDEVNAIIESAASGAMKGVLGVADRELVSIDFNHTTYGSIFDPFETKVVGNRMVRVVAWYDNEWGFTNQMLRVAELVGNL